MKTYNFGKTTLHAIKYLKEQVAKQGNSPEDCRRMANKKACIFLVFKYLTKTSTVGVV